MNSEKILKVIELMLDENAFKMMVQELFQAEGVNILEKFSSNSLDFFENINDDAKMIVAKRMAEVLSK